MRLGVILAATVLLKALAPADVLADSTDKPTCGAVVVRLLSNNSLRDSVRFPVWEELIVHRVPENSSVKSQGIHLKVRTDGISNGLHLKGTETIIEGTEQLITVIAWTSAANWSNQAELMRELPAKVTGIR